jgi:hypothetical protein
MARMYGENAQRYAQRQLGQVGKRAANEAYERNRLARENTVEVGPFCRCSMLEYAHDPNTLPEWLRSRHVSANWKKVY